MSIQYWRCMVCWETAVDHLFSNIDFPYWKLVYGETPVVCKRCGGVCEVVK